MKALVLGTGKSGKAARSHLESAGYQVSTFDDAVDRYGIEVLEGVDLFVPSPGAARSHPLYRSAVEKGIEIAGEMELGLRAARKTCLGVTGTNGKSTLCALVAHVLSGAGIPAEAVGNFGVPLIEAVNGGAEVLVVEMSSYQLETTRTRSLHAAALLPITPDHLDRYESYEEYQAVKHSLKNLVKPEGKFFSGELMAAAEFLVGTLGVTPEQFREHAKSFKGLAHRLEKVKEVDGILFVNDSKATNVAATLFALDSLERPSVLLLGGGDKGFDFSPICEKKEKIRSVVAFGKAGPRIAQSLGTRLPIALTRTLKEAFDTAREKAISGDVILLSPACDSFDHFDNYMARGEEFKKLVGEVGCIK